MIAPVVGRFVLWGRDRTGGPWQEYGERHATISEAGRWADRLRAARPDRIYLIQVEGDPAPESRNA